MTGDRSEYICDRCSKELRAEVIQSGPVCCRCSTVCRIKPIGAARHVMTDERILERGLNRMAMQMRTFSRVKERKHETTREAQG